MTRLPPAGVLATNEDERVPENQAQGRVKESQMGQGQGCPIGPVEVRGWGPRSAQLGKIHSDLFAAMVTCLLLMAMHTLPHISGIIFLLL